MTNTPKDFSKKVGIDEKNRLLCMLRLKDDVVNPIMACQQMNKQRITLIHC